MMPSGAATGAWQAEQTIRPGAGSSAPPQTGQHSSAAQPASPSESTGGRAADLVCLTEYFTTRRTQIRTLIPPVAGADASIGRSAIALEGQLFTPLANVAVPGWIEHACR